MRWSELSHSDLGNMRIIKTFPLLPVRISGDVRWLEWCYIKQVVSTRHLYNRHYHWENIGYVTKEEYDTKMGEVY